ncbi:uncharacterized protein LOC121051479 isoform X2 [Rosa chinensis]|uniref:uncharacterized protein LOC121051479 isoform X2 n=1 Tax=Rosa chinensis TaxID=74649 RepID=UPI001AD8BF68|nr:uncharacterized protein LOC121051479 isoform X2 [Rosa chinensis]
MPTHTITLGTFPSTTTRPDPHSFIAEFEIPNFLGFQFSTSTPKPWPYSRRLRSWTKLGVMTASQRNIRFVERQKGRKFRKWRVLFWVVYYLCLPCFMKKASGKASRKQKRNQFSPYSDAEFDLQSLPSSLQASLKKLCEWGKEGFKDGKAICFYKEEPIFGYHDKSFLLDVEVMRLAHMAQVTSSCIVVHLSGLGEPTILMVKRNLMKCVMRLQIM